MRRNLAARVGALIVAASLLFAAPASAIPVSRIDIGVEKVIAQVQEQFQEYLKSWVYSMSGGISLDRLLDVDSLLGGFDQIMDVKGQFESMMGSAMSDLNTDIFEKMSQVDGTQNMPDPGNEKFKKGNTAEAAKDTVENLKDRITGSGSSGGGIIGDISSSMGSAEGSAESAAVMELIAETAPMSMPHAARIIAQEITAKCVDADATVRQNNQHRYVMEVAEYTRGDIIAPVAAIMAKYRTSESEEGGESPHQKALAEFRKELESNHEGAVDAASKGTPEGKILDSIAHLQANQISHLETQNKILLYQANMMADEIQLLGYQGIMASESYNYHMKANLQDWVNLYHRGVAEITGRLE